MQLHLDHVTDTLRQIAADIVDNFVDRRKE
jgi:hypothetical protein